jgi:hypothetical protein
LLLSFVAKVRRDDAMYPYISTFLTSFAAMIMVTGAVLLNSVSKEISFAAGLISCSAGLLSFLQSGVTGDPGTEARSR